jgi:hypothetical protein
MQFRCKSTGRRHSGPLDGLGLQIDDEEQRIDFGNHSHASMAPAQLLLIQTVVLLTFDLYRWFSSSGPGLSSFAYTLRVVTVTFPLLAGAFSVIINALVINAIAGGVSADGISLPSYFAVNSHGSSYSRSPRCRPS